MRQTTSSCECSSSAHSAFYVIGNSIGISYYIKKPQLSDYPDNCSCNKYTLNRTHYIIIFPALLRNLRIKETCFLIFLRYPLIHLQHNQHLRLLHLHQVKVLMNRVLSREEVRLQEEHVMGQVNLMCRLNLMNHIFPSDQA